METIVRTYKYPILPSKTQEIKFDRWVRICRMIYNLCIEQRELSFNGHQKYAHKEGAPTPPGKSVKPTGKYYSAIDQAKDITQLKHAFPELLEVPARLTENVAYQVEQAYKDFYKNVKGGKIKGGAKKIKFSSRFDDFSLKFDRGAAGYDLEVLGNRNARIYGFAKCPEGIKVRYYRPIDGEVLQQIVKKEGGKYFLCVTVERPLIVPFSDNRPIVGIDFGVKKTLALSDGTEKMLPYKEIEQLQLRKKVLQRRLKKKKKGSKNIRKAYEKIAKIDSKVTNIRKYHLKMFAAETARDYSVIAVENLSVKNMTKSAKGTVENPGKNVKAKSGLNRVVLNSSPYFFKSFLKQKAQESSAQIIEVNPRYTSQTCFNCKHIDKANRQNQAKFVCVKCGYADNADFNAAKNILFVAQK